MTLRRGVANAVFAGTTVVLVIFASVGFGLYFTAPPSAQTTTQVMSETTGVNATEAPAGRAVQFVPVAGEMIGSAWVVIEPTGTGEYAVSVYANGLESTQDMGGTYIVEAMRSSGSMATSPIGPSTAGSEFETTSGGVGSYFVLLPQDPYSTYENIQLWHVPGGQMSGSQRVATATLAVGAG